MLKTPFGKLGGAGLVAVVGAILVVSTVAAHQSHASSQGGVKVSTTAATGAAADEDAADEDADDAAENEPGDTETGTETGDADTDTHGQAPTTHQTETESKGSGD